MSVLGFYVPPESGEKISLDITTLMALTFFMQIVRGALPPSSGMPILGTYFSFIMVMVATSVVSKQQDYSNRLMHFRYTRKMFLVTMFADSFKMVLGMYKI